MGLGNDVGCPYITQYDFWRELCYFHKYCCVSNRFALYTATLRNAQLAGIGDVTGSIAPGKSADFIVTRENPLEDLRALQHLELVVCRGRAVKKPSPKRKKKWTPCWIRISCKQPVQHIKTRVAKTVARVLFAIGGCIFSFPVPPGVVYWKRRGKNGKEQSTNEHS